MLSVRVYVPLALIVYENVFVWFPFATLPLTLNSSLWLFVHLRYDATSVLARYTLPFLTSSPMIFYFQPFLLTHFLCHPLEQLPFLLPSVATLGSGDVYHGHLAVGQEPKRVRRVRSGYHRVSPIRFHRNSKRAAKTACRKIIIIINIP